MIHTVALAGSSVAVGLMFVGILFALEGMIK